TVSILWQPPGASGFTVIPSSQLSPRYGLVTQTLNEDSEAGNVVSSTSFARPEYGLPTTDTKDPSGQALATQTAYEAPGAGFLRRTSKTLPAGNATTYAYYGNAESRANPCDTSSSANQAGRLKTTTGPDPDGAGPQTARVEESVYDAAGHVVAPRIGADPWTCTTYDARGRPLSRSIPAFGGQQARPVTYDYDVGGNPLVTSVADSAGTVTPTSAL